MNDLTRTRLNALIIALADCSCAPLLADAGAAAPAGVPGDPGAAVEGAATTVDTRTPSPAARREALTSAPPATTAPAMTTYLDRVYATRPGVSWKLLSLDAYAPASAGPHPVIVMIHGGGWRMGDKNHMTMNRDIGAPDDVPTAVIFEFLEGVTGAAGAGVR